MKRFSEFLELWRSAGRMSLHSGTARVEQHSADTPPSRRRRPESGLRGLIFSFLRLRRFSALRHASAPCRPCLNSTTPRPSDRIRPGKRLPNSNRTTTATMAALKGTNPQNRKHHSALAQRRRKQHELEGWAIRWRKRVGGPEGRHLNLPLLVRGTFPANSSCVFYWRRLNGPDLSPTGSANRRHATRGSTAVRGVATNGAVSGRYR